VKTASHQSQVGEFLRGDVVPHNYKRGEKSEEKKYIYETILPSVWYRFSQTVLSLCTTWRRCLINLRPSKFLLFFIFPPSSLPITTVSNIILSFRKRHDWFPSLFQSYISAKGPAFFPLSSTMRRPSSTLISLKFCNVTVHVLNVSLELGSS